MGVNKHKLISTSILPALRALSSYVKALESFDSSFKCETNTRCPL